jgi:hypothetical protein
LWNSEGWCAVFCDHCQATSWGVEAYDEPVAPVHEPEMLQRQSVRSRRVCGCTDERARPGGSYRVAEDLCIVCAPALPGFWMHETSGLLRPAVEAYLFNAVEKLTPEHIATLRAYLRQWIYSPVWRGPKVDFLREQIEELTSRAAIDRWLDIAIKDGLDPL